MASNDVRIRQADMIKSYTARYTGFGSAVKMNVHRVRSILPRILDNITRYQNSMKQSEQSINHQLSNARNQLNALMNQEDPNMGQVLILQEKIEKMSQLSKKASRFVEQGKKLMGKCRTEIEDFDDLTRRFGLNVDEKIAGGRNYLQEVASHITDYKQS